MSLLLIDFNLNIPHDESIIRRECRYCLSEDKVELLINPCNCEGTMKYMHKKCLQEFIENDNNQAYIYSNDNKKNFYSTFCEICKYHMKYTKEYKNNLYISIIKLIKSRFSNIKNGFLFTIHSVLLLFLIKRLRLFYYKSLKLFKESLIFFNPVYLISLSQNITILISILFGIKDIYMFYNKLLNKKRKCLFNFLPKCSKENL